LEPAHDQLRGEEGREGRREEGTHQSEGEAVRDYHYHHVQILIFNGGEISVEGGRERERGREGGRNVPVAG
jgi:hypothetical protein